MWGQMGWMDMVLKRVRMEGKQRKWLKLVVEVEVEVGVGVGS